MEGSKVPRRGLRGKPLLSLGVMLAAGMLTLASIAWACVAHNTNPSGPEITVRAVNNPPEPDQAVATEPGVLRNGRNYFFRVTWQTGPFPSGPPTAGETYEIRLSRRLSAPPGNFCGGGMTSAANETVMASGVPTGSPPAMGGQKKVSFSSLPDDFDMCVTDPGSGVTYEQHYYPVLIM